MKSPEKIAADNAIIVEELEWQLSCGQGWDAAMRALGYTKPVSLARRLQRAGRQDLASLFESPDKAAA